MVSLIRYRPHSMLSHLQQEINRLLGPTWGSERNETPAVASDWLPELNVFDKKDHYVVKVEMPGVKAEDVDVSLEHDVLTLKGERKFQQEEKEGNCIYAETAEGIFYRSFVFPEAVDEEHVKATMENGVLEITVPKSKKNGGKKIPVETKK